MYQHAHDDAVLGCARVTNPLPGACDSAKSYVRRWDWTAAGAWTGAAALATLAVLSWTRPPAAANAGGASARMVVGPGSLDVEGSF